MIQASKVIDALQKQIDRLKKFQDENVSAFVLIIPPEGETINFLTMDEHSDARTFFSTLAERLKSAIEQSQRDGVRVNYR